MVCRQGPQLPSLRNEKAFEADHIMRPKAADSHQGQGRDRSTNRPDRFVHSTPAGISRSPCAGGVHRFLIPRWLLTAGLCIMRKSAQL